METGSRSILPSGQRGGRGGEEVAATSLGVCSRAALGSAHQPALIGDGGLLRALSRLVRWYLGTHTSFWLISPNADQSPSTTSPGLILYNCMNSGTQRWMLLTLRSPGRRGGSQMGSFCPGSGDVSRNHSIILSLCLNTSQTPSQGHSNTQQHKVGFSFHPFLLPCLAEPFSFGECQWDGSWWGCPPHSSTGRRLGKFRQTKYLIADLMCTHTKAKEPSWCFTPN